MEKQIITVVLDNKPYHLTLDIERKGPQTIFRIVNDRQEARLPDFIPNHMEFDVDGKVQLDERIRTVQAEEVARAIWKAIRDQQDDDLPGDPE